MATSCLQNDKRNFWSEVKKVFGKQNQLPNVVEDAQGDEDISHLFCDKYSNLYNSVPYDEDEMNNFKLKLKTMINDVASKSCKNCYLYLRMRGKTCYD